MQKDGIAFTGEEGSQQTTASTVGSVSYSRKITRKFEEARSSGGTSCERLCSTAAGILSMKLHSGSISVVCHLSVPRH